MYINVFNLSGAFYSDLCYPYHATDLDADMTPEMKQRVYYYYNANLCEKSCTFIEIDISSYKDYLKPVMSTSEYEELLNNDNTPSNVINFINPYKQVTCSGFRITDKINAKAKIPIRTKNLLPNVLSLAG